MHSITLRSHVGKDGMLDLHLPVGLSETDLEIVMMIAAIAPANDGMLVTHTTKEFGRVAGQRLQDWEAQE